MCTYKIRLALVAVLAWIIPITTTQGAERESTSLCSRMVTAPAISDVTVVTYTCIVLNGAAVPFGVVDSWSREPKPRYVFPEAQGTLGQILDSAVRIDQQYAWTEHDGVIEITKVGLNPPILNCIVRDLELTDAVAPFALSIVEQAPDVRECALKSGYTYGPHGGSGYSSNSLSRITLHLTGLPVREALNAIVREFGRGRWIYHEYTQQGVKSFTID